MRPTVHRRRALRYGAVAAVLGAAVTVAVVAGDPQDAPTPGHDRAAERGYTDVPTVPLRGDGDPFQATPPPDRLPPMIAAPAECAAVLDEIRDLMDADRYGMQASPSTMQTLNDLTLELDTGAECDERTIRYFRTQELDPWLTWTAPETGDDPGAKGDR